MHDAFAPFVPPYPADPTVPRLWRALADRIAAIVIVGAAGMGKSHLCDCISDAAHDYSRSVLAFSAGAFRTFAKLPHKDFYAAIADVSVLIVDDAQQALAFPDAATALLKALDYLGTHRGTVVVASDRGPGILAACAGANKAELGRALEDALLVYLDQPGPAARSKIAWNRCNTWRGKHRPVDIPWDVACLLAEPEVPPAVLVASVDRVATYADITRAPVNEDTIALARALCPPAANTTVAAIQRKTCEFYRIDMREMLSPNRCRRIARPRQIAMVLTRKLTSLSLPEIGRHFGHRDHTTVLAAKKRIAKLCAESADFRREVEVLSQSCATPAAAFTTPTMRSGNCAGSQASGALSL